MSTSKVVRSHRKTEMQGARSCGWPSAQALTALCLGGCIATTGSDDVNPLPMPVLDCGENCAAGYHADAYPSSEALGEDGGAAPTSSEYGTDCEGQVCESSSETTASAAVLLSGALDGRAPGSMDGERDDPEAEARAQARRRDDLDSLVTSLGDLPVPQAIARTSVACGDKCPEGGQEGSLRCEYTRYQQNGQFDSVVAFQPDSTALWPGSLLQGEPARQGVLSPIALSRAPIRFSVSLENLTGSPQATMDTPSLSAFRAARNQILAQGVVGATPAALSLSMSEVFSSSQLNLALGASVDWPGGNPIAASFDFASAEQKTRILVNYTQAYYTIDVDPPSTPADFFTQDVTARDLAPFVTDGPPVYVQSITYGRRAYFAVESDEESGRVRAALEAAYSVGLSVGGELSSGQERVLRNATIHAFVLGGAGSDAIHVIAGFEGLVSYLKAGGNYSQQSPGAPIAYRLAYLDHRPATFGFTSEYTERNCVRNRTQLRTEVTSFQHISGNDVGDALELYGNVRVRVPVADSPVIHCDEGGLLLTLWELRSGQWVSIREGSVWTPNSPTFVLQDDVAVSEDARICLSAELWDDDSAELNPDDRYQRATRLIPFTHGWSGEHVLQLRGGGDNAVDVKLHIDAI